MELIPLFFLVNNPLGHICCNYLIWHVCLVQNLQVFSAVAGSGAAAAFLEKTQRVLLFPLWYQVSQVEILTLRETIALKSPRFLYIYWCIYTALFGLIKSTIDHFFCQSSERPAVCLLWSVVITSACYRRANCCVCFAHYNIRICF